MNSKPHAKFMPYMNHLLQVTELTLLMDLFICAQEVGPNGLLIHSFVYEQSGLVVYFLMLKDIKAQSVSFYIVCCVIYCKFNGTMKRIRHCINVKD